MAANSSKKNQTTIAIVPMDMTSGLGQEALSTVTIREKLTGDPLQENQSTSPDNGDARSRTSTEYHVDHEPWETFRHKVTQLCRTLWPRLSDDHIIIERMRGGEYNRVVGVCITDMGTRDEETCATEVEKPVIPPGDYVLRISRSEDSKINREIGILRFLKGRISLPLPTVVHSDGPDNPLGFAYVLQLRVPGTRLDKLWSTLNHAQKLLVTIDIARFCAELMNIRNPHEEF